MKQSYFFSGYRCILICCAFFALSPFIFALPPEPNFQPDRLILNLTSDPSTSQAITWRTVSRLEKPVVIFGEATPATDVLQKKVTILANVDTVLSDNNTMVYHYSVQIDRLKPNTCYAYRVGSKKAFSEWHQFTTASQENAPFQFVYLGDPQNELLSKCSRLFRAAFKQSSDAAFWLIAGDIVNHGNRDNEWGDFFKAVGFIPAMTPFLLLPGNHEYPHGILPGLTERQLSRFWRPQFTLPGNGPAGLEETCYYVDYQCARFFLLNTNEQIDKQTVWLDSLLSEKTKPWTIVSMHEPIYSTGKNRDNKSLRQQLLPIFDKHHVDLVLQGHDHAYGRTWKCAGGKRVAENAPGTVYVVSVSGPKSYSINTKFKSLMAKMDRDVQLFQTISITPAQLDYQAYDALGNLFDTFQLTQ